MAMIRRLPGALCTRLTSIAIAVLCHCPSVWAQATPDSVQPIVHPPNPVTEVVISVADYLQSGVSVYEAFRRAVDGARQQSASRLVIPPGRYVFDDPEVSQHGHHLALTNLSDLTVDGTGAELVFNRPVLGILIMNSQRLLVRGLSVDYGFSYASPGVVRKQPDGGTRIEVPAAYPVTAGTPIEAVSRFDPAVPAWASSHIEAHYPQGVTLVAPQTFASPDFSVFSDGDQVLLRHHVYTASGFYITTGASDVSFDQVTIYGAPGIGIVVWAADRGFRFSRVRIVRKAEPGRLISTAADGLHITNTRGDIIVEDCDFSGQGDDSLNIHGLFLTLAEQHTPTAIVLTRPTYGLIDVGARLRFVRRADLVPYAEATVANVTYDGGDRYAVTLQEPLPPSVVMGDLVENATRNNAAFIVRRNVFHDHRARGMLIQAPQGIVEDNIVRDVTISGIHLTSDNNFFKESTALDNVTLRRNTFIRCGYGSPEQYAYGRHMACVNLIADVPNGLSPAPIHRNITIEDNTVVDTPGLAFLIASSDRVLMRNNLIVRSNQASFTDRRTGQDIDAAAKGSIMVTRASNVSVTGNRQIRTPDMFDAGIYIDPRNTSNVLATANTEAEDATLPAVTITSPAGVPYITTTTPAVTLSGTAGDNVGLLEVTWSHDRGASGVSAGTSTWSTAGIVLAPGNNAISVTATDFVGNRRTAALRAVFFTDSLVAGVSAVRAVHFLDLAAAINAARASRGLTPHPWSDGAPTVGGVVKASHLNDLRAALGGLCMVSACAGFTRTPAPGGTIIRAVHLQELRDAIATLP